MGYYDDMQNGWDQPPPDATTNSGPSYDQVNADYEKWLGRSLTPQEYQQYWANAAGYNSGMVANSAEALGRSNQNVPGQSGYDPNVGIAPGNQTGQGQAPPPTAPPRSTGGGPAAPPPITTTTSNNPGIKPTATPPPTGPPSGNNPGAPTFTPPTYTKPAAYVPPPAFNYSQFVAPNPNDLTSDPVYQYTLKNGQDSISKSAAARGVLNTGGTINDLLVNAQDIASQGYHDLYDRKFNEWNTGFNNELNQYKTNYGVDADTRDFNYNSQYVDPFKFGYQGNLDAYNSQIHNFDQGQFYNQHNIDQNLSYAQHNSDLDKQYDWYKTLFTYQQGQDEWEKKFKLLGLI